MSHLPAIGEVCQALLPDIGEQPTGGIPTTNVGYYFFGGRCSVRGPIKIREGSSRGDENGLGFVALGRVLT